MNHTNQSAIHHHVRIRQMSLKKNLKKNQAGPVAQEKSDLTISITVTTTAITKDSQHTEERTLSTSIGTMTTKNTQAIGLAHTSATISLPSIARRSQPTTTESEPID